MLAAFAAIAAAVVAAAAQAAPDAGIEPPPGWPHTVLLGVRDPERGAAALRREAPIGLRYDYLSGANTG
jgi:hypothetical protein